MSFKINSVDYPHPLDFVMEKEPNIVAQITTMSGKTIGDINGWRYKDITLTWDWIEENELRTLLATTANGVVFDLTFMDFETGQDITVQAYRTSAACMETRSLDASGNAVWRNIQIGLSFPDCYQEA